MDKTHAFMYCILALAILVAGFTISSLVFPSGKVMLSSGNADISEATRPIELPDNIKSSAPIHFASLEEEVAYYKKNAKNPKNIDIEQAVINMDADHNGACDSCGMAILHCIEQGMEDM